MRVRLHHFGWGLLTRPHGSPALHHQKFLNDHFWEASLQVSASKMESFHELRFPSVRAAWLASRLTACALSAMGRHPCPHRGILRAWPQNQRTGRLTSAISAAAAMKTTREAYVTRRGTRPSPACTDRVCRLARGMRKTDTATSGAPEFRPPPGCKLWGAGWPEPRVWARPFWAAAPAESRTAPSQTAPPTISGGGGEASRPTGMMRGLPASAGDRPLGGPAVRLQLLVPCTAKHPARRNSAGHVFEDACPFQFGNTGIQHVPSL